MSPRGPRLAAALTFLAAGLFAGRWLTSFLADRWWAVTVSPEAGVALGSRALTGLVLDALGVLVALLWFGVNARLLLRTVAELGPRERGGNARLREALQDDRAWFWATAVVTLLALLTGTGVSEWIDALALAGSGLSFGVTDPALGIDAGWFVGQLPLWLRMQAFVAVLVLTAVAGVGAAAVLTGAVRIGRGRLAITDRARRHLGLLLAVLALVIGASRVLAPYELAAGIPAVVVPSVVQLYRSTGFVMAGLAMAAAGVSALWAVRGAHGLAAGAWFAFTAALVGAEALLPADRPDPRDPGAAQLRDRFESTAFGIGADFGAGRDSVRPALWDRGAMARAAGGPEADPEGAFRLPYRVGGRTRPAWMALDDRSLPASIVVFADDTASGSGRPLAWGPGADTPDSTFTTALRLPPLAVRPGAPLIERGSSGGVGLGGFVRRVTLSWALQDAGLLAAREASVAWHLTPAARLRQLAPWITWAGARPWLAEGRLRWTVDGYSVSDAFPVSRRRTWLGRTVAFARPGFVGVVDASSGATEIFLRPGADSLSAAWARISRGLVRPASAWPAGLESALGYPEEALLLQADLLASRGAPEARSGRPVAVGLRSYVAPGPTPLAATVPQIHSESETITGLLVGGAAAGGDHLTWYPADSVPPLAAPESLQRQWHRLHAYVAIRDSVLASGADTLLSRVRYAPGPSGLAAWQTLMAADSATVTLVAVGVARGNRIAAGRTWEEAWANLEGDVGGRTGLLGPLGVLEEAKRWAAEADSALRRGDLAAFAKAFSALRDALQGTGQMEPK